jgi:hypothetical protein
MASIALSRGLQTCINFAVAVSTTMSASEERTQWRNPSDVLAVMLLIGGEVIQAALAQVTAPLSHPFAPICFSFGWVTYSFNTLVSAIGDGRLMPEPDYGCKVINARTGYVRENHSWALGRLLRDQESMLEERHRFNVNVYEAQSNNEHADRRMALGVFAIILLQLGIAAIPIGLERDWIILVITAAGTILAMITSSLPQWRVEKYACRTNSQKTFILTRGNGSQYVMIIFGNGKCLDIEDLAAGVPPREARAWDELGLFARVYNKIGSKSNVGQKGDVPQRNALLFRGLPIDFWLTRLTCGILCVLWILLLITSSGVEQNAWFLMAVGGIGMLQNAVVAGVRRSPVARGLHLKKVDALVGRKVMDALMDLEVSYNGLGKRLLEEFFPGELRDDEREWWKGNRQRYDSIRIEQGDRGQPRQPPIRDEGKSPSMVHTAASNGKTVSNVGSNKGEGGDL